MWGKARYSHKSCTFAVFLVSVAESSRVRMRAKGSVGSPIGEMTALFSNVSGGRVQDVSAAELLRIYQRLGEIWNDNGFATATDHLTKNAKKIQPCADAGRTIGQCLTDEASFPASGKGVKTMAGHILQKSDARAVLKDPSVGMGLMWTLRVVGFIAEMFEITSRTGVSLKEAGTTAFNDRISVAFGSGFTDMATRTIVKTAIVSGLPQGAKEQELFDKNGGKDAATVDMTEFAHAVLPFIDCLFNFVRALRLDDTFHPQPTSFCIAPSTTILTTIASLTPIGEMAALFNDVKGERVEDVQMGRLMRIYQKLGEAWNSIGFASATDQLLKNSKMIQPCAESGLTIRQCLNYEASLNTANAHVLQESGKPAILKDPSPAMGFIWTVRIVGFMAEMFDIASRTGATIHDAGLVAYDHRIGNAFHTHVADLVWSRIMSTTADLVKSKIMRATLAARLPDDDAFFDHFGGRDVAVSDMQMFAQDVLPLMDCMLHAIRNVRLDDTTRPQPLSPCILPTTTTTSTRVNELVNLTSKFYPDSKTATLGDGITYLCCCSAEEVGKELSCVLKDENSPHVYWYKHRCGGIMGAGFHSWNTVRSMHAYEDYRHVGECVVPVSTLPAGLHEVLTEKI